MIAAAGDPPQVSDQFRATFVWMDEEALKPGRGYWLKLGTQMVTATVQAPEYEIDVNSLERLAAKTLELNSIGVAEFPATSTHRCVVPPRNLLATTTILE